MADRRIGRLVGFDRRRCGFLPHREPPAGVAVDDPPVFELLSLLDAFSLQQRTCVQPIATVTDAGVVANQCDDLVRIDRTEGRWHLIPGLDADWRHWSVAVVGRDRLVSLEATSDDSTLVFLRTFEDTD